MALFFECTLSCAQKLLDTADIVREAIYLQIGRRRATLGGTLGRICGGVEWRTNCRFFDVPPL
jgi:hypothetical protein